jgi:hypothetical protein
MRATCLAHRFFLYLIPLVLYLCRPIVCWSTKWLFPPWAFPNKSLHVSLMSSMWLSHLTVFV